MLVVPDPVVADDGDVAALRVLGLDGATVGVVHVPGPDVAALGGGRDPPVGVAGRARDAVVALVAESAAEQAPERGQTWGITRMTRYS